jgi:hypothetical protein
MTFEEHYQNQAIFVWTEGAPPYCWRYTIDSFAYTECNAARFSSENDALLARRDAARLAIKHLTTSPQVQKPVDPPRGAREHKEPRVQADGHQTRLRRQKASRRLERRNVAVASKAR